MMNATDANVIRQGTRQLAGRQLSAIENFLSYVQEQAGCTKAEAEKVLAEYRKARAIKFDSYMGTWHIKHGAFLDVEVLRNAINA